jgi:hypothetical protein
MTTDRSWDLSLQLEGLVGKRKVDRNQPLAHFFKLLPGLAAGKVKTERLEQAHRFSSELHQVQWDLPDGFDKLAFYLPGIKEFEWEPPRANRMVVISPFCSDNALKFLTNRTKVADALISRPESLFSLKKETLTLFSQCLHLDEVAETEDGEENISADHPTGLHAKAYLLETRYYADYTHLIIGSANATNAALTSSKNIEILVELVGKKNRVGGIDKLLGADSLGEYLNSFDTTKEIEIDTTRQDAEKSIEKARLLLSEADLSIICSPSVENLWVLDLTGKIPSLDGIINQVAWPVTVTHDFAVTISGNMAEQVRLGTFSASSVTGLTAFELKTAHPDVFARFVLNLPITGIPEERHAAVLRTIIHNQDGFIRYLLLMLGDDSMSEPLKSKKGTGLGKWLSRMIDGEDIPLLEELTRAFNRYPERLAEISKLVHELMKEDKNRIVPENFLNLWEIFEQAVRENDK